MIELSVNDVVRMCNSNGESHAFSDCVVVAIDGDVVYLSRPYLSHDFQLGAERFSALNRDFYAPFWQKVQR